MKERPILFKGPLVRAILEGRKTVTRRVIKPQPNWDGKWFQWDGHAPNSQDGAVGGNTIEAAGLMCWSSPYGKPGERLWVRETCLINDYREAAVPVGERAECEIIYRADGIPDWEGEEVLISWRPSIHMPRWASRILLEITDVRVERPQDISEDQAKAEASGSIQNMPSLVIGGTSRVSRPTAQIRGSHSSCSGTPPAVTRTPTPGSGSSSSSG